MCSPPPAGQSCASAQIWTAVTGERGRKSDVEKKAWGSKGQSPSRFFPPFLGVKKRGARRGRSDLRPACGGSQTELQFCGSCEPENQSSAAKCGKEATKRKSKFSRQVKTGRCVRQSGRVAKYAPPAAVRGGPLMWVPLRKNSPPDCFSFPSCIWGRKRYVSGALPLTPQAFYKRLDRKFHAATPSVSLSQILVKTALR